MTWIACELHTHTLHSDGRQTLRELAEGAVKLGFGAIALTDHNTMSGLDGKEEIEREFGLTIIPGMEWTTFYGHMVTIGLSEFADWRQAGRSDIDRGIAEVHRLGGIAGLAHPFRIGSPACTGCFWEYAVGDWNAVDYIEVWSGTFPSIQTDNRRAFKLWTAKLNEGYRIAAVSGRDWHAQEDTDEPISVTYLEIEDRSGEAEEEAGASGDQEAGTEAETSLREARLIRALGQGRACVTIGPLLTMTLEAGGKTWPVGSAVPAALAGTGGTAPETNEAVRVKLSLDFTVRSGLWSLPGQVFRLKLCSNLGEEVSLDLPFAGNRPGQHEEHESSVRLEREAELPGSDTAAPRIWLRAELWGTVRGAYTRIAFTNAVYFDSEKEGGESR